MTHQEALRRFSSLSAEHQLRLLAAFGHSLTVVGRDTYEPGLLGLREPQRLRAINEVQHRLFAYISALAEPDARVKEPSLLAAVFDIGDPQLQGQIQRAFAQVCERCAV